MIHACKEETLDEVRAALDDGASENATDEEKCSALMWASFCGAESIVVELLKRDAFCDLQDHNGNTALNYAVKYSGVGVVQLLLDAKSRVDHPNDQGQTPLMMSFTERTTDDDDEAVKIAHLLLDNGAKLEHKNQDGRTALHYACRYSTSITMVQLLLDRKAAVNAISNDGSTSLMQACFNHYVGEALIPILVAAGADTTLKDKDGDTVLLWAFASGGMIMRALAPFIIPAGQLKDVVPPTDCADPVGTMHEAVAFGFEQTTESFFDEVTSESPSNYCWSFLRLAPLCLNSSTYDVFNLMAKSVDPKLWYYVICELGTTRHPKTGDTLLHVAARTGKHFAVDSMMRRGFNPFIRNTANQRPLDIIPKESVLMMVKLQSYAQFRPTVVHMEWMGPYFRQRVVAFLCVLTRWRNQGNETIIALDRNIVSHVIFRHLARMEYV